MQLTSLPPAFVYVGQSSLSLGDIRSFNRVQQTHYELHRNDCRYWIMPLGLLHSYCLRAMTPVFIALVIAGTMSTT